MAVTVAGVRRDRMLWIVAGECATTHLHRGGRRTVPIEVLRFLQLRPDKRGERGHGTWDQVSRTTHTSASSSGMSALMSPMGKMLWYSSWYRAL